MSIIRNEKWTVMLWRSILDLSPPALLRKELDFNPPATAGFFSSDRPP
jgi:hypothetical protein